MASRAPALVSGHVIHGDIFLLENAQDAQVGNATREASAEGDTNAGAPRWRDRGRRLGIRELTNALNRALKPGQNLLCIALSHWWNFTRLTLKRMPGVSR